MAFLQPLQYQSMFVPTNIGLMNQQIMQRDAEYRQNEAMLAAAQDKYAQITSHPSATGYKNQLLDQLQADTQKMIDDYGGDIGAIDKRTLINKINSIRPEIQDIQRYTNLAEEQRKATSIAGTDLQQGLGDFQQWKASGKPNYKIGHVSKYQDYLDKGYDDIGKMIRDSGLYGSTVNDAFLAQKLTEGITVEEQSAYKDIIKQDLMRNMGSSESVADDLATQKVMQLTQGYRYNYRQDPAFKVGDDRIQETSGLPVTMSYDQAKIDSSVKNATREYDEFVQASSDYNDLLASGYKPGDEMQQFEPTVRSIGGDVINRYNEAIKPYKNNPTFNDMVSRGANQIDAAKYISKQKADMYARNAGYYKPTPDNIKSDVRGDLVTRSKFNDITTVDSKGRIKDVDSDDFKDILGTAKVEEAEFNIVDGTVKLTMNNKGKLESYEVPMENIQNNSIKNGMKMYKSFLNDIYSQSDTKESILKLPGGAMYRFWSELNSDMTGYDKSIEYIDKNGTTYNFNGDFQKGLDFFGKHAATSLVDNYGKQVNYEKRKR